VLSLVHRLPLAKYKKVEENPVAQQWRQVDKGVPT